MLGDHDSAFRLSGTRGECENSAAPASQELFDASDLKSGRRDPGDDVCPEFVGFRPFAFIDEFRQREQTPQFREKPCRDRGPYRADGVPVAVTTEPGNEFCARYFEADFTIHSAQRVTVGLDFRNDVPDLDDDF